MKLKQIRLNNVRTYLDTVVDFGGGVTLLAGDVGAGKSTLLLAVEFALFGLQRGDLTGSMLLRFGEEKGFVELKFVVGREEYLVKRELKRSGETVVQGNGFFASDSGLEKLTPGELKSRVLNVLNYPREMLTKKSLVYRYTVYAVQEEMKQILLGAREDRVDTLRKVFNIDKYKRIKENSKLFLTDLRTKQKVMKVRLDETEKRIQDLGDVLGEKFSLDSKVKAIAEKKMVVCDEIIKLDDSLAKLDEKKNELNFLKQELIRVEGELKHNSGLENVYRQNLDGLNLDLVEFDENELFSLQSEIKSVSLELDDTEEKLSGVNSLIIESRLEIKNSSKVKDDLHVLDNCPTCLQSVSSEHKGKINSQQDAVLCKYSAILQTNLSKKNELELFIDESRQKLDSFKSKERELEILLSKRKDYEKSLDQKQKIGTDLGNVLSKISVLQQELISIKGKTVSFSNLLSEVGTFQGKLETCNCEKRELELEEASLKKELELLELKLKEKESLVLNLDLLKVKFNKDEKLLVWTKSRFLDMINEIEKNVLARIYSVFNSNFQKWFDLLMGESEMNAKLDSDFTPFIQQNGYDLDYLNLSGGERTACALAYRLALNQVINDVIGFVNTSDLIILDEPTDGFSSEQLDRMRLVLDELNIDQIIVVSHEEKIESFCDNILRIEKRNGVSGVI